MKLDSKAQAVIETLLEQRNAEIRRLGQIEQQLLLTAATFAGLPTDDLSQLKMVQLEDGSFDISLAEAEQGE